MCCGSRLVERNCQHGVVCALRIRKATSFSEGGVFVPDRGDGVDTDRGGSQLIGLNLLILVTIEIISELLGLVRWRLIGYLQLLFLAIR